MKFPNLPAAGVLTGAEIVPITQAGVDKRTTISGIGEAASEFLEASLIPFSNTGFSATNVEDAIVEASAGGGGGGTVDSVVAGHGTDVNATDPSNPIVAVDETELDPALIPFAHSGFSANNVEDAIVEAAAGGGGGGSTQGKQAIYISASAMAPSVTGGCAGISSIASAANQPDIVTLDFDPTTQEYAQFSVVMPKKWNEGTLTFKPYWSHASTTTNFGVVWNLQAVAVGNDEAIATAFGTAQTSTDTGGTTNDMYAGPESSAITVAGSPAAEEMVFFRISRVTGDSGDTMAVDARLHGLTVFVTTDADTDA